MKKNLLKKTVTQLLESAQIKYLLLDSAPTITYIADLFIQTLKRGNKIIVFGNGGSASDAQHISAELAGRFNLHKRRPLPAISLTTNTSLLTSISNDYGFNQVFARQLKALYKKGDLVIAISTSGNSPNILEAIKTARKLKAKTVGFTGKTGGKLKKLVNINFSAPSKITARIQECHITAAHIICDLVEKSF